MDGESNGQSTLVAESGVDNDRSLRTPITRDGAISVPSRGIAAWYMLAYSTDLRPGKVIPVELHGRELVLYRGEESGRVFALAAHCSHMGVNLQHGAVVGDEVQCPMHKWQYGGDGSCSNAPGEVEGRPPSYARQRSFPVVEKYGAIFVFNGKTPHVDVPSFVGVDESRSLYGQGKIATMRAHWVPVAVNAFDGLHLSTVHDRALRQAPDVDRPCTDGLRLSWHADPVGTHIGDKVTRKLARGAGVRVSITNQGGMLYMIESQVGKLKPSNLLLGLDPIGDSTSVRSIFPVSKSKIPGWSRLRIFVQRWLIYRFLEPDARILERSKFRPRLPLPEGEPLTQALEFLNELPAAR